MKRVKITGSCHPPIEVVSGDPGMGNFQSEGFLYRPRAACCPLQLQEPSVCLMSENTGWESGLEIKWATGTGSELSGVRYDCSRVRQPSFAGTVTEEIQAWEREARQGDLQSSLLTQRL